MRGVSLINLPQGNTSENKKEASPKKHTAVTNFNLKWKHSEAPLIQVLLNVT